MNVPVDVLIVGAGSAGSIMAERLSADPSRRVTVLEAGPDRSGVAVRAQTDDVTVMPIGPDSPVVRRYRTALTATQSAEIVRGSVLGGSGAVNGGYFCRARPADFDGWPPGWSWSDVEPHYRAVERRIATVRQREFALTTMEFVTAAESGGFGWLPRLDGAPPGIAAVPLNVVDGVRLGPGRAFLEPVRCRPNLAVLTDTRATRLIAAGDRVTGVQAVGPDGPVQLRADRVVLCAGAVETARLLMLSGIGPADASAALGIPVLADLPVGQHFCDHPEWLTSAGRPATAGHPVLEAVLVTDAVEIRPYTTGFGADSTSIGVALMRPRSRGRMTLASADPTAAPRIEHRYDSDPADSAELRAGYELIAELVGYAGKLGEPVWSTSQHLCGTAPMGAGPDAVVDPECRVCGLTGLWVVDGSVLPAIPSRGPHATIAMLAHRAAGFF